MSAAPALALDATRTTIIAAEPTTVWKTIGRYCGISDWHPAIETCAPSEKDGKKVRTLSLKGGGTIAEQEQSRDEKAMADTYTILESPLPVSDYGSTPRVIAGIYESGFKGLSEKAS